LLYAGLVLTLLAGCGGGQPAAQVPASPTATTEPPTATTEPPTPTSEPPTATATTAPPTPTATTAPPTPTATAAASLHRGIPQGVTADGVPLLGSADAPVLLIDYSDFLCPTCQRYIQNVEPALIDTYISNGQVRLAFRPVLNHGERSLRTSEAAACAARQEQFWAMHDLLFARQADVWATPEAELTVLMQSYASEIGLDPEQFAACVAEGSALAQVQAWDAEQRARGIAVQPVFEINGQRLIGFQPLSVFQNVIDAELAANQ
jgi:protein-disulfide isomerase